MTRPEKSERERACAARFFNTVLGGDGAGLVFTSANPPHPDVWVSGARLAGIAGDGVTCVGVELTDYHSGDRAEVEHRWEKQLLGEIEKVRVNVPTVLNASIEVDFNDPRGFNHPRLPRRSEHRQVAEQLVRAVEAALPKIPAGILTSVCFIPRATLERMPSNAPGLFFLAREDFPAAADHFNVLKVRWHPDGVLPLVTCPRLLAGWASPHADVFTSILEKKGAANYDTQGRPLWLLIVADLENDRESHVVPTDGEYLDHLHEQVAATGFDFAGSQFQQVWLFSEFNGCTVRLHPAGSPAVAE
jgi:hypothetical protein